ncbi:MAG: dihydrolipoyllysine-residue acetyltransferase [Burkholderiales bacterium]|jgi:pyruvate dehydrogenase E2 component (dihydrolipoamide acetyltransferase)|nr:dihydrolipoyllysine-residue acetyltransferase [Burkholderiales bacterium]
MSAIEVKVPDIGDFKEVEVIEVLVKPGDTVAAEQSLITVESDKASMEIPSSAAGVVRELKVKLGDKVSEGTVILLLEGAVAGAEKPSPSGRGRGEAAGEGRPQQAAAPSPAPALSLTPTPPPGGEGLKATTSPESSAFAVEMAARPAPAAEHEDHAVKPHASPSVRKFARELGVELAQVRATGPKGRITQDDVRNHVKAVMTGAARPAAAGAGPASGAGLGVLPWPQVDFAKFGPVERVEMSRIKKLSGPNLHRNWVMIPHVTNHEDADITELEAFRVQLNKENEKSGVKLTMLAFLIKACVAALKKFPQFNASIDGATGDAIFLKSYYHIGFAADTPNGLVVPVVKDADKKGVFDIAAETAALAAKAREGKLSPADMQGGTFSISSLGGIGGTYFTPIINAPEVAILGVCKAATRPVWDGKAFVPRLILPLSLSWDHRVVDGAAAARFNAFLAQLLADFRRAML